MKKFLTLLKNIGQLVTLAPLVEEQRVTHITKKDLGTIQNSWLLLDTEGCIHATGSEHDLPQAEQPLHVVDAQGGLVLPGFVDSHVHLIWAGSRADEMARRLSGESYQSIAASGGGIATTMRATREASDATLLGLAQERTKKMLRHGITSLEAKSGYGLSIEEELRHLRLLQKLKTLVPQSISPTCLALHAASPEHPTLKSWVDACARDLLPLVAQEGLADAVDAFIEQGYFSVEDVEPYIARASSLGLKIRLHADEFSQAGGAMAAARWRAASADHLQCAAEEALKAMAEAEVTATLLPGTSLFTKLPFTQGRPFGDAGVPLAIGSDFNPGSCMLYNLPMLAAMASIHAGLTPEEVIAGITLVPARSLGLQKKGALTAGWDGDFVLYKEMRSVGDWLYDFGQTSPDQVWIRGSRVL